MGWFSHVTLPFPPLKKSSNSVLVSWDCRNKVLNIGWLKTTEIYPYNSRGQEFKIKVLQGCDPSAAS